MGAATNATGVTLHVRTAGIAQSIGNRRTRVDGPGQRRRPTTARTLVDSMTTDAVVRDDAVRDPVPGEPMRYDEAVRAAFAGR